MFTCFPAVSSNVNNGAARQVVISAALPLAFTTGRGSSEEEEEDVREAVTPGRGQLPLLRLITLGAGDVRGGGAADARPALLDCLKIPITSVAPPQKGFSVSDSAFQTHK